MAANFKKVLTTSGVSVLCMENLQGFAETLLHCIRLQSSVTFLYGCFSALNLPIRKLSSAVQYSVAKLLKILVSSSIQEVAKILMYGLNIVNRCVCLRGALSFGIWYNPYRLYVLTWI